MKKGLIFFLFFLFPAMAQAIELNTIKPVPPYGVFSAMSAQSLDQGSSSFGLIIERSNEPDFFRYTAAMSYGISNSVELTFNLPYLNDHLDGLEDFTMGVKYRLLSQAVYGPSVALLGLVYLPIGREELSRDGAVGAGLLITEKVGPFTGHLNGIWITSQKDELRKEWDLLGALTFPLFHNMEILGEFQVRKSPFTTSVDLSEARFGYRLFNEYIFGTLGLGIDLKNRSPEYRILFSLATRLPKKGFYSF